jgi:aspartate/methionine/tyrosine aminotransferase
MRPTSRYLEILKSEVFHGEAHLGGSTPHLIAKIAKKPIRISLDPAKYPTQSLNVKIHLAKAGGSALNEISLVTGSTQACFQTLAAITDPGDSIIIEYPGYEPFLAAAKFLGLNILRYRRSTELAEDMRELRSLAKSAKVLLLSNPHCPTGWTYSAESLKLLAELDLVKVIDEVFLPMCSKGTLSHRSLFAHDENFIFLSGLSKPVGFGTSRIGWIFANPEFTRRIYQIGLHLETDLPQPLLPAAELAFKNWKSIIRELQGCAAQNRQAVFEFGKRHPTLLSNDFKKPFFAMLKVPESFADGKAFTAELLKHGILVRDGAYFEMPEWVRFHALMPKKQFAKAFAKISSYY